MYEELISNLREHAEWARANEWESPIMLGDDLEEAANALEAFSNALEKLKAERDRFEQMYLRSEADAINLTGELTEVSAENARLRREREAYYE